MGSMLNRLTKSKIRMGGLMRTYSMHLIISKVRNAAKIRNRYNQAPHLTQDTTWENAKNTIKNHRQEPRGQPFPAGDHLAAQ